MAYTFYLDGSELPVTPSKLTIKIKNQNKTVNLINEGEVNILKTPGLSEVEFDFLLPAFFYPFSNGDTDMEGWQSRMEALKTGEEPFQFIVSRTAPGGGLLWDTNMTVSLEDYTIKEDAKEGRDVTVAVKLKQYRFWGSKKLTIKEENGKTIAAIGQQDRVSKPIPDTCTVQRGDSLSAICQKYTGGRLSCWDLAKLNGIGNPNLIQEGQTLRLK